MQFKFGKKIPRKLNIHFVCPYIIVIIIISTRYYARATIKTMIIRWKVCNGRKVTQSSRNTFWTTRHRQIMILLSDKINCNFRCISNICLTSVAQTLAKFHELTEGLEEDFLAKFELFLDVLRMKFAFVQLLRLPITQLRSIHYFV